MIRHVVYHNHGWNTFSREQALLKFILQRVAHSIFLLLSLSLLVFLGVYALGNPVDMLVSPQADQEDMRRAAMLLGLDQPLWRQYVGFLWRAMHGQLGDSFTQGVPALSLIWARLPATLELALVAIMLAVLVGIPLGLIAALAIQRPRTAVLGKSIMAGSILGISLPTFWIGLMLIMIFSVYLGWLPASGRGPTEVWLGVPLSCLSWQGWRHLMLPALTLSLVNIATVMRLTWVNARDVLQQDYIRFARAKGLSTWRIIAIHVLKNTLIPLITILALQFGNIMAFSIVTESIFAWPGMGKLMIDAINMLDRPVIIAYILFIATIFVFLNLLVDVLYGVLDPRVRLAGKV